MTYWDAVCVLLTDSLSLSLALLERVLVLELGAHVDGMYELGIGVLGSYLYCRSRVLKLLEDEEAVVQLGRKMRLPSPAI